MIALSVDAPRKITAFLIFMFFTFMAGFFCGKWQTNRRWEKATAEVVWHCVQDHRVPVQPPQRNSPDEKASIVPTEEDRNAALISAEQ
jgi:hypothetical protein